MRITIDDTSNKNEQKEWVYWNEKKMSKGDNLKYR